MRVFLFDDDSFKNALGFSSTKKRRNCSSQDAFLMAKAAPRKGKKASASTGGKKASKTTASRKSEKT